MMVNVRGVYCVVVRTVSDSIREHTIRVRFRGRRTASHTNRKRGGAFHSVAAREPFRVEH